MHWKDFWIISLLNASLCHLRLGDSFCPHAQCPPPPWWCSCGGASWPRWTPEQGCLVISVECRYYLCIWPLSDCGNQVSVNVRPHRHCVSATHILDHLPARPANRGPVLGQLGGSPPMGGESLGYNAGQCRHSDLMAATIITDEELTFTYRIRNYTSILYNAQYQKIVFSLIH